MNTHKNAWLTPRGREPIVRQVDGWDRFSLTTRRVTYSWKIGTTAGRMFGSIASVFTVLAAPPLGRRRSVSQKR